MLSFALLAVAYLNNFEIVLCMHLRKLDKETKFIIYL